MTDKHPPDNELNDKGKFAATFQPAELPEPIKGSILEKVVGSSSSANCTEEPEENGIVSSTTAAFEIEESLGAKGEAREDESNDEKRRGSRSPGTPTKDERETENEEIPSPIQTGSKSVEDPSISSQTTSDENSPNRSFEKISAINEIVETSTAPVFEETNSIKNLSAKISSVTSSNLDLMGNKSRQEVGNKNSTNRQEAVSSSRNKFRALNLVYPAALSNETLKSVMDMALSFHTWFEGGKGHKKGGISFQFHTDMDAKAAFEQVRNLDIEGNRVKIQAPRNFASSSEVEEVKNSKKELTGTPGKDHSVESRVPDKDPDTVIQDTLKNDEDCRLKLHISQLLPSTHDDLIYALFDKENLKSVHLSLDERKTDGSKVAILTFLTEELARDAKREYDGFSVDDGEVSRQIRIVWYLDFLKDKYRKKVYGSLRKVKLVHNQQTALDLNTESNDQVRLAGGSEAVAELSGTPEEYDLQAPLAEGSSHKAASQWSEQIQAAKPTTTELPERELRSGNTKEKNEEMSIGQIKGWIESVVAESRVNWAELNTAQDLWSLCDKVQEQAGWIPDEKLKTGMLKALETDLLGCKQDWMYRHLEQLIKMWKKETKTSTRGADGSQREFQLKAPEYEPPPSSPKKRFKGKEHRRQVLGLMGVGALLAQAREKAQGEEGELKEGEESASLEGDSRERSREKEVEIVEKKGGRKRKPTTPPLSPKKEKKEKKRRKREKKEQLEEGEMPSSSGGESNSSGSSSESSLSDDGGRSSRAISESQSSLKSGSRRRHRSSSSTSGSRRTSSDSDKSPNSGSSDSDGENSDSSTERKRKKDNKGRQSKSRQKRKEHREKRRRAAEKAKRRAKREKKAAVAAIAAGPSMADFTRMMQTMQANGGTNMSGMLPQMMSMFQQMWMQRMNALQKLAPDKQQQTMQKMQTVFQQFQQQYQMAGGQAMPRMPMPGQYPVAAGGQPAGVPQQDWAQQFRSQVPPPPTSTYSAPPTHYYPPPGAQQPQQPPQYAVNPMTLMGGPPRQQMQQQPYGMAQQGPMGPQGMGDPRPTGGQFYGPPPGMSRR